MKITQHITEAKETLVSFEVLPPLKGRDINVIYNHLNPLMDFNPAWINVTYHRSESVFRKLPNGSFEKVQVRKRPGTVGICAAIKNHYGVDTNPHMICAGFTRNETEDALIDLNFLGINNLLVLRGDAAKNETGFTPEPGGNRHALDLLQQVVDLNKGIYLDTDEIDRGEKMDFCPGVAGYPEKHFEAPNLESDIDYLKKKVDIGAEYIMTQMFFDNQKYYDFVDTCRRKGINVPIIPGLKPITRKSQLNVLPSVFHVDIPTDLSRELEKAGSDAEVEQIGTEWLIQQSKDLKAYGVPVLHYYTLGKPSVIRNVVKAVL